MVVQKFLASLTQFHESRFYYAIILLYAEKIIIEQRTSESFEL